MRTYLDLDEVRALTPDTPLVVSWYDHGTRYGAGVREASMRRDVVKLTIIDISNRTEFHVILHNKEHSLIPWLVDGKTSVEYQVRVPISLGEEESFKYVLGMSAVPDKLKLISSWRVGAEQ